MKWEYSIEQMEGLIEKDFVEDVLNTKGQKGWELVSSQMNQKPGDESDRLVDTVSVLVLIFKRPVE